MSATPLPNSALGADTRREDATPSPRATVQDPAKPTTSRLEAMPPSAPPARPQGLRSPLSLAGSRSSLLSSASSAHSTTDPRPPLSPEDVAQRVTSPARSAVSAASRQAAAQPPVEEKKAAVERQMRGDDPEGTIVEGMEDDRLWVMLRGFNKQVNHVLHPARTPASEPDLRQTNLPNVPYRSDTLKSNLERLIAGLGPPAARGTQELLRLTDWDGDFNRTAAYCASYFVAWVFGYVVLGATAFFVLLICFPKTRRWLFPYRPPPAETEPLLESALETPVDDRSYKSVAAFKTPMTGAEKHEEISVEVTAVMSGYASALLFGSKEEGNAVVGPKDLANDWDWDDPSKAVRDEAGNLLGYRTTRLDTKAKVVEVRGEKIGVRTERGQVGEKATETEIERKRNELVTWMAKSTETGLGGAADYIEIMQKALSPPVVYPDTYARFKMAALLVFPALAIHYVPARVVARSATFGFGAVFWGRKWLEQGMRELIRLVPNWKELLDPRSSILSGVPTDAQLTLHLLRVSEGEQDPLPVPPMTPALEATKEAIRQAPGGDAGEEADVPAEVQPKSPRKKGRTKGLFRKVARKLAGMGSDVAVVGAEDKKLRRRIDSLVLKAKWGDDVPEGGYSAKLDGKGGHLYIDEDEQCLSWVPLMSKTPDKVWYIDDLVEMKKDGLGVSRLALAAMSGAEIASLGLSLRFAKRADDLEWGDMTEEQQMLYSQRAKETLVFKGVEAREALFNRLIAMGNQRWEML